jgi:hypothetical protein
MFQNLPSGLIIIPQKNWEQPIFRTVLQASTAWTQNGPANHYIAIICHPLWSILSHKLFNGVRQFQSSQTPLIDLHRPGQNPITSNTAPSRVSIKITFLKFATHIRHSELLGSSTSSIIRYFKEHDISETGSVSVHGEGVCDPYPVGFVRKS